jgi:DNA polymerase-3 subunit delta
MLVAQALKNIAAKQWERIYVCLGSERFLMDSFIHTLTNQIVLPEQQELAISRFDMRETSLTQIIEDAETLPFMVDTKLILVSHAYFLTAGKDQGRMGEHHTKIEHQVDELVRYVQSPADHSVIVFMVNADKLDDRKKIVKLLKSKDVLLSFFPLKHHELKQWIKQHAAQVHIRLTEEAVDIMMVYTSGNLLVISREMEKLSLLIGTNGLVEAELVEQFVSRGLEENIFLLIDQVVSKNTDRALVILHDLLRIKEEPIKILILIVRQFRIIMQVKQLSLMGYSQSQIASQLGIAQYAVQIAQAQGHTYSFPQLTEIIAHLSDLDYQMKSGNIDKALGLELIFLKIAC